MTVTAQEARKLALPALAFALLVGAGVALIGFVDSKLTVAQRELAAAKAQRAEASERLAARGIAVVVGPVARAAGVGIDTRVDQPAAPYFEHPPLVAVRSSGDVLARFQVMLAEAGESVRLIGDLLDAGADAETAVVPPGGGCGLGWAESPRGEALAWVMLDDSGRIIRARLRPASARNWRGFDDACRSQNVFTDIPIIEASFWLTVAGTAR